jgi:MOSC domain-containing protein YiiM
MNRSPQLGRILGLYAGKVQTLWDGKPPSAIAKSDVGDTLEIIATGCAGDEQADLVNHGGTEKAVHHYPSDHYPFWRETLGDPALDFGPGRFGENIASEGVTEDDICIGDLISIGTALFEVSQGRQPCWKIATHTRFDEMAHLIQKSLRTGWYYRVVRTGAIRVGDPIILQARPNPGWTVRRVTEARFTATIAPALAAEIAALPALSASWRPIFEKRAMGDPSPEDKSPRLTGPQ